MPRRLSFSALAPALGFPLAAALVAVLVAGCANSTAPAPEEVRETPRLVLLLAIDQLRPDRLSESLPGGLGRLMREGRVFLDAALEHAFTETCSGHATMLTGRHPARVGIPGNSYTDPETLELRYCVEDRRPDAALLGVRSLTAPQPADGRSPRIMRAGTLGDWMKQHWPDTRVFGVSAKDRAAIPMAGLRGDAAYWLARGPNPGFVTSRYYMDALPAWVRAWGPERILAGLPADWTYLPRSVAEASGLPRPDDYRYESPLFSRVQPHPLLRDPPGAERLQGFGRHPAGRLYVSPYVDRVTLAFAKDLVEAEGLGSGGGPDLLAVSLSATDLIGHFYGPESWESRDALVRLDTMVGDFLAFLEARVGERGLVVVLTADHGVLPVPEWLEETNRSHCPLPGGRIDSKRLLADLEQNLDERFAKGEAAEHTRWFALAGRRLTLDRTRTGTDSSLEAKVLAAATTHLEAQPGIARVWSREEVLAGEGPEPMAHFYRNSWSPAITGDLALQVDEDCLLSTRGLATSHGSPHLYDRAVPLVIWGPEIEADRVSGRAATVDIAPTLADYLGVAAPVGLDGTVLRLRMR